MKTLLVSSITFLGGLGVGMQLPWQAWGKGAAVPGGLLEDQVRATVAGASHAPAAKSQAADAKANSPAAAAEPEPRGDPFMEWAAAFREGQLASLARRSALLKRMAQADPAQAWRVVMASGLPVSREDVQHIAEAWYEKDPAAAAAFGLTLTDPLQRPAFLQRVLSKWMLEKPGAFAAWFHTQPAELDLARYLKTSNMVYQPGSSTLEELDSLLRVNAGFRSFPDFLGGQAGKLWSRPEQRQATAAWLRRVDDPALRDVLWKHVVAAASEENPQAAAELVAEIGNPKLRGEASSTVAAQLARRDPAAALDYAASLPDEKAARNAWQSAMGTWSAKQPAQALAYLRQNTAVLSTEVLSPVLRRLGENCPAEVLAIVAELPASTERGMIVLDVLSTWRSQQPEAAARWGESKQAAFLSATEQRIWQSLSTAKPPLPSFGSSYSITVNGRVLHYVY